MPFPQIRRSQKVLQTLNKKLESEIRIDIDNEADKHAAHEFHFRYKYNDDPWSSSQIDGKRDKKRKFRDKNLMDLSNWSNLREEFDTNDRDVLRRTSFDSA